MFHDLSKNKTDQCKENFTKSTEKFRSIINYDQLLLFFAKTSDLWSTMIIERLWKRVVMLGFCLNRLRFLEVVVSKKIDQLWLWNKSLLVFCLPPMLNNTMGFLRVLSASNKNTCTLSGCWYISTPGALKIIFI